MLLEIKIKHIVFLEHITNRLEMVQTRGNMCDEGVELGSVMQSKVKLKFAPLRRYSRESAENLHLFIDFKCEMLPIYSRPHHNLRSTALDCY